MRRCVAIIAMTLFCLALCSAGAWAQAPCSVLDSAPPFQPGGNVFGSNQAQWLAYFQGKVDANNGLACNLSVTGTLTVNGVSAIPAGGIWGPSQGGTGVSNGASTITVGGNFVTGGALSIGNMTTTGDILGVTAAGDVGQVSPSTLSVTATGGSTAATLATRLGRTFNVVDDFGADPTGSTDSTADFTSAIAAACAANGGTVLVPPGTYKISSTLTIGNGSSSGVSTCQGVYLKGLANPNAAPLFGFSATSGPDLKRAGSGSPVIAVDGPLSGWGVQNLYINCQSTAGATGIQVNSAQEGDNANLAIVNCQNTILSTVVSAKPSGIGNIDSLHNAWRNISILMPNIASSIGFKLTGNTLGNTDYNDLDNIVVTMSSATGIVAFDFAASDSNTAKGLHVTDCTTGGTAFLFDYSINAGWPAGNSLFGIDPGVAPCSGGAQFANNSTPSGATPNFVYGLSGTNGAVPVGLANLVFADGPWISYTPTLSCSSGTLSSAAAAGYYSIIGDTVHISIEVNITTNGSCSGTIFATLPTVAPAATAVPYILNAYNTGAALGGIGFINPGSSTTVVGAVLYNGTYIGGTGDFFVMTGVYQTSD